MGFTASNVGYDGGKCRHTNGREFSILRSDKGGEMTILLEGAPSDHMRGWTHYQLLTLDAGKVRSASFIGTAGATAAKMRGWKFYERGTWEMPGTEKPGAFAKPRPEILDALKASGVSV
jgi:hypothetical protein